MAGLPTSATWCPYASITTQLTTTTPLAPPAGVESTASTAEYIGCRPVAVLQFLAPVLLGPKARIEKAPPRGGATGAGLLRAQGRTGDGNTGAVEQHDDEVDDVATEVNNARQHEDSPLFDYRDLMFIVRGCP